MIAKIFQRAKEYYSKVMDLPDSPKKVALGVAMGTAMDFLPVPIISIPISYVLAKLLRINAAAAVLAVIFFKWAVPFFFAVNYMVGRLILGGKGPVPAPEIHLTGFDAWLQWVMHLGYPFLLGAFINASLAGTAMYFLVKRLLLCRQLKRKKTSGKLPRYDKAR